MLHMLHVSMRNNEHLHETCLSCTFHDAVVAVQYAYENEFHTKNQQMHVDLKEKTKKSGNFKKREKTHFLIFWFFRFLGFFKIFLKNSFSKDSECHRTRY